MSSYYEETDEEAAMPVEPPPERPKPTTSSSTSRIATLASLIQSEDKENEEEGQAFYAGGSERSGQQVLGPGKRKGGPQIVEEMFKAAKSHGAQVIEPTEHKHGSTQLKAFRGAGYVLGSTPEGSEVVGNAGAAEESDRTIEISLRAWRTGFTIDDGPLREYSDPQHKEFLDAIRRGEIPPELIHKARGGEVSLNIEDHSHEDYVPPKVSLQAFTGTGHRLGSPTPPVSGSQSKEDLQKNEAEAQAALKLDEAQPVTTLQIRLADGSRLVVKLNYNHTVGDIRRYLVLARPEYSATVFSLRISYPTKELTDDSTTIKDQNLLNTVIVQTLK